MSSGVGLGEDVNGVEEQKEVTAVWKLDRLVRWMNVYGVWCW